MLLLALGAGPLRAQAQLVKDINAGSDGSGPAALTAFGGELYFRAFDGVHGDELWRTDGTAGGTVLVEDINLGSEGSGPARLTVLGDALYFLAWDGERDSLLWRTDGTEVSATPLPVVVFDTFSPNSELPPFFVFDGALYFTASHEEYGVELWRSDGTEGGTALVKDINPDDPFGDRRPSCCTAFDGALYFAADDGVHGRELWRTDGTEAGTSLVKDIDIGSGDSVPGGFTEFGGGLYSSATDGVHGRELWKTDGTDEGTVLAVEVSPGAVGSNPGGLTVFDGELYFIADDGEHGGELWRTDGTEAGTSLVKDINPGGDSGAGNLIVFDGALYFAADDGEHGAELWRTDGTEEGTVLLEDIRPGSDRSLPAGVFGGLYPNLTAVDGWLYFLANDGEHGMELWKTDGTEAGTVLAADVNPGPDGGFPDLPEWTGRVLTAVGSTLYFRADDGVHGVELWRLGGSGGTPTEPGAEPSAMALGVWPNPARGAVSLALTLEAFESVRVAVYDGLGRRVAVLHDGPLAADVHTLRFEAAGLPSGLYVVRASGPLGAASQRVTLLR